jgi:hypothetical protein
MCDKSNNKCRNVCGAHAAFNERVNNMDAIDTVVGLIKKHGTYDENSSVIIINALEKLKTKL